MVSFAAAICFAPAQGAASARHATVPMERIKAANAKTTMNLRIDISLFVGLFTWPPSQQLGIRKQIDLAFSSIARPPMGTIAAFDFADVGTLRWRLVKQSILFSAGPAGGDV
jgi:hypothetical protein